MKNSLLREKPVQTLFLLGALLILAFNLRPTTIVVGPVLSEIQSALHLTGNQAGILTALPTFCYALFGLFTAMIERRLGTHKTIIFALFLLLVGQGLRTYTTSAFWFLAFSALAMMGVAFGNILIPALTNKHFPHHIGLVTALYAGTINMGIMAAAALTVPIAQAGSGWQTPFEVLTALAAFGFIIWIPLAKLDTKPAEEATETQPEISLRAIGRTRLGLALAVMFGFQSSQVFAISAWLPTIYIDSGMEPLQAGFMLTITTIVGLPISFFGPAFITKQKRPFITIMVLIVCLSLGLFGLLFNPLFLYWLWPVLLSLGFSIFPIMLTLMSLRAQTPMGASALSTFIQSVGYFIASLIPYLTGVLHEWTASWQPVLWLWFACSIPLAIASYIVCESTSIEAELSALSSK